MAKKSKSVINWLQATTVRLTRVHFFYVAAYVGALILFDSWNLFTHDAVAERWTAIGALLILNVVLWYTAKMKFNSDAIYLTLVITLILADIIFASFNVYWERGLASKSVVLFSIPIVTAAVLRSRSTLLATAGLSVAAYSIATVRYFNLHYGESYRIELWGYLGLFCAIFFILAGLLMILIKPSESA